MRRSRQELIDRGVLKEIPENGKGPVPLLLFSLMGQCGIWSMCLWLHVAHAQLSPFLQYCMFEVTLVRENFTFGFCTWFCEFLVC